MGRRVDRPDARGPPVSPGGWCGRAGGGAARRSPRVDRTADCEREDQPGGRKATRSRLGRCRRAGDVGLHRFWIPCRRIVLVVIPLDPRQALCQIAPPIRCRRTGSAIAGEAQLECLVGVNSPRPSASAATSSRAPVGASPMSSQWSMSVPPLGRGGEPRGRPPRSRFAPSRRGSSRPAPSVGCPGSRGGRPWPGRRASRRRSRGWWWRS